MLLCSVISNNSATFINSYYSFDFYYSWCFQGPEQLFQHWQDFHIVKWKHFIWRNQKANVWLNCSWHISTQTTVTTCICQPWIRLTGRKTTLPSHFVHPLSDTTFRYYASLLLFGIVSRMFHCDLFWID